MRFGNRNDSNPRVGRQKILALQTIAASLLLIGTQGVGQAATVVVDSAADAVSQSFCTFRGAAELIDNLTNSNYNRNKNGCGAIGAPGDSDTISFSDSLAGQTILVPTPVTVSIPVIVSGPQLAINDPSKRVTLSGDKTASIFSVSDYLKAYAGTPNLPLLNVTIRDVNFINAGTPESNSPFLPYGAFHFYNNAGAIAPVGAVLLIERCDFKGNITPAMFLGTGRGNDKITIRNVKFVNNTNPGNLVSLGSSNLIAELSDVVFSGNTMVGSAISYYGGYAGRLDVTRAVFENNTSSGSGAAINAYSNTPSDHTTFGKTNISQSTFTNNRATTGGSMGGAIYVQRNMQLNISDSTFAGNEAQATGGAITAYSSFGLDTPSNAVNISRSVFNNNAVGSSTSSSQNGGGAVYLTGNGYDAGITANIEDTTFVGNTAALKGGAIGIGMFTVLNGNYLTFVNNSAPAGAAAYIIYSSSRSNLKNSLIAGNPGAQHCAKEQAGIFSGGKNIEWRSAVGNENSCNSSSPVLVPVGMTLDQIVATTLADNGGLTKTLALPVGSPAIDAGDPSVAGTTDQRGQPRVVGSAPDLGAFEFAAVQPPAPYTHADVTTRVVNGVTLTTINGQVVPSSQDVGKNGAVFVFTNITGTDNWLLLNPNTGWHPWVDCNSTAYPYVAGSLSAVTNISLFYDADLSAFRGWPVLFGYGVGSDSISACTDMFNNGRYTHVTTL